MHGGASEACGDELHDALKESLNERGVLNSIRATIRAEIFNALENHEAVNVNKVEREPSSENLILNELIREYLEYNGFLNTLSVFHPETGQPREATGRIGRSTLVHELGLADGERTKRVPLLYSVLAKLQTAASRQVEHPSSVARKRSQIESKNGPSPRGQDTITGFDFTESQDDDILGQSFSSRSGQAIGFSN